MASQNGDHHASADTCTCMSASDLPTLARPIPSKLDRWYCSTVRYAPTHSAPGLWPSRDRHARDDTKSRGAMSGSFARALAHHSLRNSSLGACPSSTERPQQHDDVARRKLAHALGARRLEGGESL
jgi:hypothetical protein